VRCPDFAVMTGVLVVVALVAAWLPHGARLAC
jgi:hypothetical protein